MKWLFFRKFSISMLYWPLRWLVDDFILIFMVIGIKIYCEWKAFTVEYCIKTSLISYWIYGHSHQNIDKQ